MQGEYGAPGIRGEPGDAGDRGRDGPKGWDGVKGRRGESGFYGLVGGKGQKGPTGDDGDPGQIGRPGKFCYIQKNQNLDSFQECLVILDSPDQEDLQVHQVQKERLVTPDLISTCLLPKVITASQLE